MVVECEDEEYLDLFNPESLEYFHQMRYIMLNKSLAVDPEYKYHNAAVADTQVFDTIRKLRSVSVIRYICFRKLSFTFIKPKTTFFF